MVGKFRGISWHISMDLEGFSAFHGSWRTFTDIQASRRIFMNADAFPWIFENSHGFRPILMDFCRQLLHVIGSAKSTRMWHHTQKMWQRSTKKCDITILQEAFLTCQRSPKKCDVTFFQEVFVSKNHEITKGFWHISTENPRKKVWYHIFFVFAGTKSLEILLKIARKPSKCVDTNPSKSLETHQSVSTQIHQNRSRSMGILQYPRKSIKSHDHPSRYLKIYESPRNPAKSIKIRQEPWKPFEIHRNVPWNPTKFSDHWRSRRSHWSCVYCKYTVTIGNGRSATCCHKIFPVGFRLMIDRRENKGKINARKITSWNGFPKPAVKQIREENIWRVFSKLVGLVGGRLLIGRIFTVYFPYYHSLSEIQQKISRRFPENFPKPSTKKGRRFLVDGFGKFSENLCDLSCWISLNDWQEGK